MENQTDSHLLPADADNSGADAPHVGQAASGGEVVSRTEFNKVVGQRQAAKDKVRHLTAEVEQLQARLGGQAGPGEGTPSPDSGGAGRAAGDASFAERPDELGDMDRLPEPVRAHIRELSGRKETLEKRLADLLADRELRAAASRGQAINPDQVVALLRGRVRMIETTDGRFEARFADPGGQVALDGDKPFRDVRHFVDTFLARPENANLVRSTVLPGSGARQAGAAATAAVGVPLSKAECLALSPGQRLAAANRMTRRQRDGILGRNASDDGGYI